MQDAEISPIKQWASPGFAGNPEGFRLTWRVAIDIFSPKHLATSLDST